MVSQHHRNTIQQHRAQPAPGVALPWIFRVLIALKTGGSALSLPPKHQELQGKGSPLHLCWEASVGQGGHLHYPMFISPSDQPKYRRKSEYIN